LIHERVTEEVRELAALYALGALTQHEARSFEIHLRDCPVCTSELRRLEHASAGIGLAAEEMETPEYLRDLLLARIERETPIPVSVASANPNEPALKAISKIDELKLDKRGSRSSGYWRIACVFLIFINLASIIKLLSIWHLSTALQTRLTADGLAADELRKKLEDQKNKPADIAQILEVKDKPGMRIAWLAGQPPAQAFSGTLFWDMEQHRYLLMGSFPPAPQGKAYQLWFVTPATKVSAGLIQTNPDGSTYATVPISIDPLDATAVGITLEPDGGSSSPTTRFCASGRFN
jgi:anti-sigma-K factor RskA